MKTSKKILYLLSVLMIFTISSCKVMYTGTEKKENIRPVKLYDNLILNEYQFENLSIKFSATAFIGDDKQGFNGNIRIQKDSIIWISLRNVIEAARISFTQDSVKFINYLNNTYFTKDLKSLGTDFGIDLDYNSLQSILTNSFFFYPCVEDEEKAISNFKQCYDANYHCISSISKRKYSKYYSDDTRTPRWEKKLEKEIKDSLNNREANDFVFQTVKVLPDIFRIHDIYLENHIQMQTLYISYDKQVLEEGQYFPRDINIELLSPYIKLNFEMNVESVRTSAKPFSFPFKIGSKYQEIKLP